MIYVNVYQTHILYAFIGGIIIGMLLILIAYILSKRQEKKMYDPVVITLLEQNVKELQGQLVNAHKRIKVLTDENYELRRKINIESNSGYELTEGDVWKGDSENPDATHIKKDFKTGGQSKRKKIKSYRQVVSKTKED